MIKPINAVALFRLSVIGPLVSRARLEKGELKALIKQIAKQSYQTPDGRPSQLSEKTLERWYYLWRRQGVDGLEAKPRTDCGKSNIADDIQQQILFLKQEQRSRSINTLIKLLEEQNIISRGQLSRSSVHRLLSRNGLSKRVVSDGNQIERRSFEAEYAGDIWHGDVMHGPSVMTKHGKRKVYLVSYMDDATRLICHSSFYLSETALSIEHALKEALLKRGLPKKIIVDNGPAYRSSSMQTICSRLDIRLVYCRPYEPQGKGKLERWHRTLREEFLTEINLDDINSLDDLNSRLWVWLEHAYHQRPHSGLKHKSTPLARWQQNLLKVRPLGSYARDLDAYFYHRVLRCVRKDGTLSWEGDLYEVPYEFCGQEVNLVVEPFEKKALYIECLEYKYLSPVHPLDKHANCNRRRQRPEIATSRKPTKGLVDFMHENSKDIYDVTKTEINEEN